MRLKSVSLAQVCTLQRTDTCNNSNWGLDVSGNSGVTFSITPG